MNVIMEQKKVTDKSKKTSAIIANFTCTFNGEPLLSRFFDIVYPALSNKEFFKENKKSNNRYHISDLKLIQLSDGNIALIGKHIKRTVLEISPDFNKDTGFIGKDSKSPSAPFATFILLLNNHKIIYFKNKKGAPTLKNFQSTCREIINEFIEIKQNELVDQFKDNNYIYNGKAFKYLNNFRKDIVYIKYPYPELNIVPVESKELVRKKFSEIKSIKKVSFKFYPTNNEPINYNNMFELGYKFLEETQSTSMNQQLNSPKNIKAIENAISTSGGKTYYNVIAKGNNEEDMTITADSVSETIPINIYNEDTIEIASNKVYNQVKNKEAIKEVSVQNSQIYTRLKESLLALIK